MIKKLPQILAIFTLFTSFLAHCAAFNYSEFKDLQIGDIILQDLNCWSCKLIEEQENSAYSHMGIFVIKDQKPYIFEALGKVKLTGLNDFINRTAKDGHLRIIRTKDYLDTSSLYKIMNKLLSQNLNYDHEFRWNNVDERGEIMYCSELVFKVWQSLKLINDLKPKIMNFDINPLDWDRFFKGNTPRGEIGISPEDFNKASEYFWVKDIWRIK